MSSYVYLFSRLNANITYEFIQVHLINIHVSDNYNDTFDEAAFNESLDHELEEYGRDPNLSHDPSMDTPQVINMFKVVDIS